MQLIFTDNKKIYIIDRLNGETNDYFYEKGKQIALANPTNNNEFNKAQINAQLYCNKKYLKCSYN